jgi:hypothetical protein
MSLCFGTNNEENIRMTTMTEQTFELAWKIIKAGNSF